MIIIERSQKAKSGTAINPIDITRKSADDGTALLLAPDWGLIKGVKQGNITADTYKRLYLERLLDVLNERPDLIDYLCSRASAKQTITFICYCPDDDHRCHTYLAAAVLIWLYPDVFAAGKTIEPFIGEELLCLTSRPAN